MSAHEKKLWKTGFWKGFSIGISAALAFHTVTFLRGWYYNEYK